MDLKEMSQKAKSLADALLYLAVEGIELLQQEQPLTFEEWKVLYLKAHAALLESNFSITTQRIFEVVMMRGIKDAAHLLPPADLSEDELNKYLESSPFCDWVNQYLGHMVGFERIPDVPRRAKIIDLLLEEIAVPLMKRGDTNIRIGQGFIDQVSVARFPDDHNARIPFKSYWESRGLSS